MDDKLQITISFYEEEKNTLQKMINECADEQEFLLAHYHTRALYQLQIKIDALKSIDDRLSDKKNLLQHRIKNLERILKSESQLGVSTFEEERLIDARQKLAVLNQSKNPISPSTENSVNETIIKLLTKEIKSFNLVLKKSKNLILEFSISKRRIKLTLPFVKQHLKTYLLDKSSVKLLQRFGFNYNSNSSRLILKIGGNAEEIIERVNTVLSVIVFEIFDPNYFTNESFIEIV